MTNIPLDLIDCGPEAYIEKTSEGWTCSEPQKPISPVVIYTFVTIIVFFIIFMLFLIKSIKNKKTLIQKGTRKK